MGELKVLMCQTIQEKKRALELNLFVQESSVRGQVAAFLLTPTIGPQNLSSS